VEDNKLASAAAYAAALRKILNDTPEKLGRVSGDEFNAAVNNAIASDPMKKANITSYTPDDYNKFKTFLSNDKQSGYAIKPGTLTESGKPEGISVFSNIKGRGPGIVEDAVDVGGAKQLDAFDINNKLPKLYGKEFKETYRYKFDPQYAPADWDYDKFGKPDVIGMELDPEKAAPRIGRQVGKAVARFGLPAIALGAASDSATMDEALANLIVPGGASNIGEDQGEEAALMGESQGYKDYQLSQARRDALKALRSK
jgi:hypothetical protein